MKTIALVVALLAPTVAAAQASAQFLLLTAYSTSYSPRKAQVGVRVEF